MSCRLMKLQVKPMADWLWGLYGRDWMTRDTHLVCVFSHQSMRQ